MKRILITVLLIGVAMLMASTVLAVDSGQDTNQPAADQVADGATTNADGSQSGQVPQAQIDRVKKREELNQRRAELLKVRQQLIETDDPGNVDGQKPIQ